MWLIYILKKHYNQHYILVRIKKNVLRKKTESVNFIYNFVNNFLNSKKILFKKKKKRSWNNIDNDNSTQNLHHVFHHSFFFLLMLYQQSLSTLAQARWTCFTHIKNYYKMAWWQILASLYHLLLLYISVYKNLS